MIIKEKERYKIDLKYCKQCGACLAVCPKEAIASKRDSNTGLLQLEIKQDKCIKCGLCLKHCPAVLDFMLDDVENLCGRKNYFLGHSINAEIRKFASSGGVARTIIVEGLKKGLFDGVYTLKRTDNYPFAEGTFYSSENVPNYEDIPNSIYHSVPAAMNMSNIRRCDRLLIVGTTCQLYALEKYARRKCNELYSLCIFCKQQKTFESTRFIAKMAGVSLNSISSLKTVSYRGNGWPGYCTFNGMSVPWGKAALMPFGKKLWSVPGCDVCGNPFGDNSDITVLDPWIIEKENDKGENLIVVSSEKGENVLSGLSDVISRRKVPFDKVKTSLMLDDIMKKNILIPYFRRAKTSEDVICRGTSFVRFRFRLQNFLNATPRMPIFFYRVLNKLLKDKR